MSVLFEKIATASGKYFAVATLDAEKSLNALSLAMIESLHNQLNEWATDPSVLGVLICGKGRAFCAGGDVRALYQSAVDVSPYIPLFFEKEYKLDASLYSYPKPLIVWAHGITMGGGMGIMQGARYRIVTDSTRLAMPEITIGLFPDVGASYFLRKVPANRGLFLALTGLRFKANEACCLKMADYWMDDGAETKMLEWVKSSSAADASSFDQQLKAFFESNSKGSISNKPKPAGDFFQHEVFVDALLKNKDVLQLTQWAKSFFPLDEWEKTLIHNIQKASPSSLALIYTLWEKNKGLSVEKCFSVEWLVASQCGTRNDFKEGVRALLIDKTNNPQWNPATVQDLSPDWIASYFVSPHADKKNPLDEIVKS